MSALDHAFIRAFTGDPAGKKSPQKSEPAPPASAATATAAPDATMAPRKFQSTATTATALVAAPSSSASLNGFGATSTASIVPSPHMDLSAFATSVSTLDVAPPSQPASRFQPVRIDPPQLFSAPPAEVDEVGSRESGVGSVAPAPQSESGSQAESIAAKPIAATVEAPKATELTASFGAFEPASIPSKLLTKMPLTRQSITQKEAPVEEPSQATDTARAKPAIAFEVDQFAWPATLQTLIEQGGEQIDALCQQLLAEAAGGKKIIAVTGLQRGEGRSTMAMLIAKRLAISAGRVALVDADFSAPQLATRLGLVIGAGWEQAISMADGPTIWETMIESVADRLAVAPLASRSRTTIAGDAAGRLTGVLGQLRDECDIAIVDAGPLSADGGAGWLLTPGNGVDAAVLVTDSRSAAQSQLADFNRRFLEAKIAPLGVIENHAAN